MDFLDHGIDRLQEDVDGWAYNWIYVNGRGGVHNLHPLIDMPRQSTSFIWKRRNLYRYLNQGWEYQNE
jgi:hypothetical protein